MLAPLARGRSAVRAAPWPARWLTLCALPAVVALIALTAIHAAVGSAYSDNFRLSGTQSFDAVNLLERTAPKASGDTEQVVIAVDQGRVTDPAVRSQVAPMLAALPLSAGFGSMYFPGFKAVAQGDIPLLDAEIPAANGVATARGLARMYGAIANGGRIDGSQFLSPEVVAGLTGRRSLRPDGNLVIPLAFHLGYHRLPFDVIPGFGHVGLGGSLGWADPESGLAFGFVHNRLLTPLVIVDHAGFVATSAICRMGAAQARKDGFERVADFGSPFAEPGAVAG